MKFTYSVAVGEQVLQPHQFLNVIEVSQTVVVDFQTL